MRNGTDHLLHTIIEKPQIFEGPPILFLINKSRARGQHLALRTGQVLPPAVLRLIDGTRPHLRQHALTAKNSLPQAHAATDDAPYALMLYYS